MTKIVHRITESVEIDSEENPLIYKYVIIFLLWKTQSFDRVKTLYC